MFAQRWIALVDMDAFFASVEQRDRPELRGKPVVVGGRPGHRGVVAAASYEARRFGIRSAMPIAEAYRRCPHAAFLPPRGDTYGEVSAEMMTLLGTFSPRVEPMSVDEAFCDLTGCVHLWGSAEATGRAIRDAIRRRLDLPATVGIASNKFLAKLAAEIAKPDGLKVFEPEEVPAALAGLPVRYLWGAGPRTQETLERFGFRTFGDLQRKSPALLRSLLGTAGEHFWRLANGADERNVDVVRETKSVGQETTMPRDIADRGALDAILLDLSEGVAERLRAHAWQAGGITVKIRIHDFTTRTRARRLDAPTAAGLVLFDAARALLSRGWDGVAPVRLLGVQATHLSAAGDGQTALFGAERETRLRKLGEAVDRINERFGERTIRRGRQHSVDEKQRWIRPRRETKI
jgi:DNA polymerase-4